MTRLQCVLSVFLAVGAAAAPAAASDDVPPVRVEDATGQIHEGRLVRWDAAGSLLEQMGSERLVAEPVVLTTRAPEQAARDGRDVVLLAVGPGQPRDRLCGRLEAGDDYGLVLAVEGVSVELPFEEIDRLLPYVDRPLDRLADLAGGGFDDRVWRRRDDGGLDGVVGVVSRLAEGRVVLESGLGELPFELQDVLAVVLAATEPADVDLLAGPDGARLPRVRVALSGGSLFAAGLLGSDGRSVRLRTRFVPELQLPLGVVHSLCVESDARVLLADLQPVETEERPSLGGSDDVLFPWRRDLGVAGAPLRVDGLARATGLGVHANARLRWVVPDGARSFRVRVGVTDDVLLLPATASVRCELRVDGKTVASSGMLREGDPPVLLEASDLGKASTLELVLDDGGDLDAGDRAAFVDGWFGRGR